MGILNISNWQRKGSWRARELVVISRITSRELALHCHRTTRSAEEITENITNLIEAFDGDQGHDTLGVPLFNHTRIWEEWEKAREHVSCILDPPGIQLYTEVGTTTKGGVELKVYRCARGSTSLESFHLHLNHFIPGKLSLSVCKCGWDFKANSNLTV